MGANQVFLCFIHSGRMRRTILNGTVLDKPRGITVHPTRGYMFYTDWSSEKPCVCRTLLDGSSQVMRWNLMAICFQ